MHSGLDFLLAAKRCEIDALRELALTSELVDLIARLVHALQRERGLSNLFIASQARRFAEARTAQLERSRGIEAELRARFRRLDSDVARGAHGARLFSRIAYVLQGLDGLDALRAEVQALRWDAARATDAYVRLVAGLLGVVFEAADSATDPAVSRQLAALFNFMQGKEFAGQERATGSALFMNGRADAAGQQRLLHLIESQERCLELFAAFAPPPALALWDASQAPTALAELERLRRVLCTSAHGAALRADLGEVWFDTCSQRIDGMRAVEEQLAQDLRARCETRIAQAQAELDAFRALDAAAPDAADPLSFFRSPADAPPDAPGPSAQGFGPQLDRSILALVHEQAQRLQAMGDELETVRASLNERRLIERAKGLLMAHRHLSEPDAHKALRQMAMNQNRRLVDVAEAVLSMAEVLPPR